MLTVNDIEIEHVLCEIHRLLQNLTTLGRDERSDRLGVEPRRTKPEAPIPVVSKMVNGAHSIVKGE